MSTQQPIIEDAELGILTRAESTLEDGERVVHDWFAGTVTRDDHEIELVIDGESAADAEQLLPRTRAVVAAIDSIRRSASDAVITRFSDSEPSAHELDEGYDDLVLDAIEATADSTVLHFTDSCGLHFPAGFWPAVQLDANGDIADVTVES